MKQSLEKVISKAAVAVALIATSALPVLSEEISSTYKLAEPKFDNSAPPAAPKSQAPLTGNIQRTERHQSNPLKGKSFFNGRYSRPMSGRADGRNDTLNGRADDSLSRPLASQVQSSVGIIGVKFIATMGQSPVINQIFPGTPAEEKGLRVYDKIVAVDGIPTAGLTKDEVFDLIVGSPGTKVTLSIMRNGDFQAVNCTRMDINELTDPRVRRDYMINL